MNKKKIKNFLKQYEDNRELYGKFIITVENILNNILIKNNFRYQPQSRIKDINSLNNKLEHNEKLQNIKSVFEVEDICGCRILFYLDSDINKFKRYIYNEFDVKNEELKYSPSEYNAYHLTVKLSKERLVLSEYSSFKDFLCEIQLTTILYHVWSEMAHDIIYKDKEQLSKFDEESFKSIEKIFQDIMKNYLKKASYSFEFAYTQFEKLKMGKKVFSPEFFSEIINLDSLNEMHEHLSLLYQYIQKYGDKIPEDFSIINIIKDIIQKSKDLRQEPIKSFIGDITGYGYIDIVKLAMEILEFLRYRYPDEVIEILMYLSIDEKEEIRKKSLEAIGKMAEYNLNALEQINFGAQLFLLEKIEKLSDEALNKYVYSICTIMKEILDPEFEGQTMESEGTLTIRFGPLQVTEQLKSLRRRAINILKRMYRIIANLIYRTIIIETFDSGAQLPTRGEVSNDMLNMVIEDANYVLDFYLSVIINADNEIIRNIEEQLYWFTRRFKESKLNNLNKIREIINSNEEYSIYNVFVGFVRGLTGDYENEVAYREKKTQDYINNISASNFKKWKERIISIAEKINIVKTGELHFFNKFLNTLGKQKPELAIELIVEKKLDNFLLFLVAGIWQSDLKAKARDLILKWIDNEEKLDVCARLFFIVSEIDLEILNRIFKVAKRRKNIDVLIEIVNDIIVLKCISAKELFLETIKELTINNSSEWTRRYLGSVEDILNTLSEEEYEIILENLLIANNISYNEEEILIPIARKSPEKIITLFYKRIILSLEKKIRHKYHPIPFSLGKLSSSLQNEKVLNLILKWFDEKNRVFHLQASHLIKSIFPQFGDILENKLFKLLDINYEKNIEIVFDILEAYEGKDFIFDFCRKVIGKYSINTENKKILFRILARTGTVSGEYGFVEAYERKKELIQSWKEDINENVKTFAIDYEEYLNKYILYEVKEADEEIKLRKIEFER